MRDPPLLRVIPVFAQEENSEWLENFEYYDFQFLCFNIINAFSVHNLTHRSVLIIWNYAAMDVGVAQTC